jgi:hypothetical protein
VVTMCVFEFVRRIISNLFVFSYVYSFSLGDHKICRNDQKIIKYETEANDEFLLYLEKKDSSPNV